MICKLYPNKAFIFKKCLCLNPTHGQFLQVVFGMGYFVYASLVKYFIESQGEYHMFR